MKMIRSFILVSGVSAGMLMTGCFSYHSVDRPAAVTSSTMVEHPSNSNSTTVTKKIVPNSVTTTVVQ